MAAYKKLSQRLSIQIAALCLVLMPLEVFAQSDEQIAPGVLRIKVSEELAAQLEKKKFTKSLNGDIITGIESLDNVHKQLKVKRLERVFRHAGKFEAKHQKYGLHLWYEVSIDKGSSVSQAIQSYKNHKGVHKAEPIYKKTLWTGYPVSVSSGLNPASEVSNLPSGANDPMLPTQWHYNNTGQTGGTLGADIKLADAWTMSTGNPDVVVSIHDEGVQVNHVDLAANIWRNQGEVAGNNLDDDGNGYVDDVNGYSFATNTGTIAAGDHGTHVAGTIAAITNNGMGVAGIAGGSGTGDGVRIMSCAVFANYRAGGYAESFVYAADNGAIISQNSWGYASPGVFQASVLDGIDYFIAEAGKDENGNQIGKLSGGLVIFSAGNAGSDGQFYPGYYEPVFAVASTTHKDVKAYYSNYGSWIDVSAPGGETNLNKQEGVLSTLSGNNYGYFMGTSMACPHVSGVVALIISKFSEPGFTPEMVMQRMKQTADDIDALNPGYGGLLGAGRVNAYKALLQNDNTPPPAIKNLSVKSVATGEITLQWTVPKDAATFVAGYDLRYSNSPITSSNFTSAIKAPTSTPSSAGTTEVVKVTGLIGGSTFYFAVKSIDFAENISAISNVVSQLSAPTPLATFSPTLLSQDMKTAQTATRTFTINNSGHAPLDFTISSPTESSFAAYSPMTGVVSQGGSKTIIVTFDANDRFAGTYQENIAIRTNDPEKQNVSYPLTMVVANNNAPIAVVSPDSLLFESLQISTSLAKSLTIHNSGSNSLTITKVVSNNSSFIVNEGTSSFTIAPFADREVSVTFQPESAGMINGMISVHSNDPVNPVLNVFVIGEGLNAPPIVVAPNPLVMDVSRGTIKSTSLIIQNNGSFERSYALDWTNVGLARSTSASHTTAVMDSARIKFLAKRKELIAQIRENPDLVDPSIRAVPVATDASGSAVYPNDTLRYITDFEDFNVGIIDNQHGWAAGNGWTIERTSPSSGVQHIQGTSTSTGTFSYAFAPPLNYAPWWGDEEQVIPRFTYASMMVDADAGKGARWDLVFQDDAFLVTRVRFMPDGTIQALSVDEEYESHWHTLPVTPSGYFEFAIEHDIYGDEFSGFPGFRIFIDRKEVLFGYSLGAGIVQVVLGAAMDATGPSLSIDELAYAADEYIPQWIDFKTTSGILLPHESTTVAMDVGAESIGYGVYSSEIDVKVDNDLIKIPAELTVSGPLSYEVREQVEIEAYPDTVSLHEFVITNTGGTPITFNLANMLPWVTLSPSTGTIPIRGSQTIAMKVDAKQLAPDFYYDAIQMAIPSTGGVDDKTIRLAVTIWEPRAQLVVLPVSPSREIHMKEGEVATVRVPMYNKGEGVISYKVTYHWADFISYFPAAGKISRDTTYWMLTIDGKQLPPGRHSVQLFLRTNDPDYLWYTDIIFTINVVADPGRNKISREEWAYIGGSSVADIPLSRAPTSNGYIDDFQAPVNKSDYYGARIRGYVLPPRDTTFTFWIASDDAGELWLSTDKDPANKKRIAYVNGHTLRDQRTKYPSQRSVPVSLKKDQLYYIEALHKEAAGADHLTVWWSQGSSRNVQIIPSSSLLPFDWINLIPEIAITFPRDGEALPEHSPFKITTSATDAEGRVVKVEFYRGSTKVGEDVHPPYEYESTGLSSGTYTFTAVAVDNYEQKDSASISVKVDPGFCAGSGKMQREIWTNISGRLISSIPLNTIPSSVEDLETFESLANIGDNFGSRIRGYVCVPQTGHYTFWIAGDDHCELWLSPNEDPNAKIKIASISGSTRIREWYKYTSQQSALIYLEGGRKYYIEALHKEALGGDHVAVGWLLPDGTLERPIGGNRIIPFQLNQNPMVKILSPSSGETFTAFASIAISVNASDADGTISKVEFFANNLKIGENSTSPYSFAWNNAASGNYSLTAKAIDNAGGTVTSDPIDIRVTDECSAKGSITREYWANITGTAVSDIPVNTTPTSVSSLALFESPSNVGNNYGARVRGYICVPVTGSYTFWISSDDNGELWLSADDDPANKTKIASVPGHTYKGQWNKYATQKSVALNLVAGQSYYIEALHKEASGADHIAVAWMLPDGTLERPIPGNRLIPFDTNVSATNLYDDQNVEAITLHPNPAKHSTVTLTVTGNIHTQKIHVTMTHVMTGKIIYSESLSSEEGLARVDFDNNRFTPGVYMVSAIIDRRRFVKRLIIE